ncbi:PhoH family protein [Oerskovia turbata]|uniref:PhoH-like protein n=1 Tax=Oerskovia turbata TaxID=1713 RepID=A0A4Q1L1J4_9CELL|nr:PhoH family protein [Oerskovia turbata]RXR36647.1 PhoH family protein [Oerskovia turbata]TGJ97344.1 PhoH family protein [Actinotalea fermentans ATCC 43279 = JCM 9966 = DSM 3133]
MPSSTPPTPNGPAAAHPSGTRVEHRVVVPPHVPMVDLLGSGDVVLRAIESGFPTIDVHARGNEIAVTGPVGDVALASRLLDELVEVVESGTRLTPDVVTRSVAMLTAATATRPAEVLTFNILSSRGRTIRPKTVGQKRYVDAIDASTVTFGIGPAGTGKTYLAMAKAVQALQAKQVSRIVLTRPAVEAGERLGFLPGSLSEKIDPYLRPLYDALHDMIDPESIPKLIEAGTIEVAPLGYMRGRTLNDAFIILDEAQNTSTEQMKMFLTRLGFGSKMVITGDVTQVDLPGGTPSGLRVIEDVLTGVDDIEFCRLTSTDVVRHRLVSDIIDAYARWDVSTARPARDGGGHAHGAGRGGASRRERPRDTRDQREQGAR